METTNLGGATKVTYSHRDDDLPPYLKWTMNFINRIGFPIVAFGVMSYMCFISIKEQTTAINQLKEVFISMKGSIDKNTEAVERTAVALKRQQRDW